MVHQDYVHCVQDPGMLGNFPSVCLRLGGHGRKAASSCSLSPVWSSSLIDMPADLACLVDSFVRLA